MFGDSIHLLRYIIFYFVKMQLSGNLLIKTDCLSTVEIIY